MGDAGLVSRARAVLRLSSSLAGENSTLLTLIGESLVECGDVSRAERPLQRAVATEADNFRGRMELADLALRNGKLAHVIHHYPDPARLAPGKALPLYLGRKPDYYARLNIEEDYLVVELRRILWLQNPTP